MLTLAAAPAAGAVRPQNAVMAFPGSDLVIAEGSYAGTMTVKVIRGSNVIGTASGPAQEIAAGVFGLEVNHGLIGLARPGDCWDGSPAGVPDIQPGDTIEVTDATGVDSMLVRDLTIEQPFIDDDPTSPSFEELVVEGTAPGLGIDEIRASIEVEFRHRPDGDGGDFRRAIGVDVPDELNNPTRWRAVFAGFPIDPNLTPQEKQSALHGEFAVSFGHTPPQPEVTIQELGAPGGAAPGCDPPVFPPPPPPPPPAPPVVVTSTPPVVTPPSPILRTLRAPAAISRAGFLRKGVTFHVKADSGARVVKMTVWRLRGKKKPPVRVGTFTRALPATGQAFITLRKRDIGSAIGTYAIEATAGAKLTSLGGPKRTTFRISE